MGGMGRGKKGEHSQTAGKVEKVDAQGRHAHGQFRGAMDGKFMPRTPISCSSGGTANAEAPATAKSARKRRSIANDIDYLSAERSLRHAHGKSSVS